MTDWLPFLEVLANQADEIALKFFRKANLHIDAKSDMSPVSEADKAIEEVAYELVQKHHPDLGFFGEEQGDRSDSQEVRLIIDPIDATRNFIRGIPIFATLLAIEEKDEIIAGLVSAPALATRWRAARGLGAFRNEQRIRVSGIQEFRNAQVFHGDLSGMEETSPPEGTPDLLRKVQRTRGFGDFYQHMLVAEGAGEVAIDPEVRAWDVAALQVIVEEAGGKATTLNGERSIHGGSLITSNGLMHEDVLKILAAKDDLR
ncbi:MAG: inositol monophosphatase family protein [bacterium]